MAHYAQIDPQNGLVTYVFVGRDDHVEGIESWEEYYAPEGFIVKKASYNTYGGVHYTEARNPSKDQSKALRKNYPGPGFTYDFNLDAFVPPRPSKECVLDEETCLWVCPEEEVTDV